MSVTIQVLAVVGKTLNCPEHRESLQKKFRKIREQNKEVNNMAKEGRKNRKQIKKEMNRENQREVKVLSYNICTSQYRGWYVYVKTLRLW
jgi:hypothetical protein